MTTNNSEEMEAFSFLDAQKDSALLNPIDDQLSDAMASQVDFERRSQSGNLNRGLSMDRQVEVVYGQQREEEAGLNGQGGRSTESEKLKKDNDPIREAQNKKRDEEKEQRRILREAEETKVVILRAIETRRIIRLQKVRLDREGQLCSSWSAGRSGSEALGRQISGLWQSSRPTEKEVAQRDALIKDAEEAIEKKWPGCGLRLVPFGSTRTGLIESRSDVDLTLFDPIRPFGVGTPRSELESPPKGASHGFMFDSILTYGISQLPDYYSVNMVASALRRSAKVEKGNDKFVRVQPISKARVPIVKFVYAGYGLSSDINVNDCFGNVNSEMLAAYCEVDTELVRPFLFAIKKWASRRGLNDPSGKSGLCSLNSYTICMIAIQFLQIQGVVPNLQSQELTSEPGIVKTCLWQKPPTSTRGRGVRPINPVVGGVIDPETGARRFDTTFVKPKGRKAESLVTTKGEIPMTILERHVKLGQLFTNYFIWLSEFNFDESGFSIRIGQPFRKNLHPKSKELLSMPHLEPPSEQWEGDAPILCQDPFIVDRNTTSAIKMEMRQIIIDECCRARTMLEEIRINNAPLLSGLLVDHDHEEIVHRHEVMMQSLDSNTRSIIVSKSPTLRGTPKTRKNRGKGKSKERQQ